MLISHKIKSNTAQLFPRQNMCTALEALNHGSGSKYMFFSVLLTSCFFLSVLHALHYKEGCFFVGEVKKTLQVRKRALDIGGLVMQNLG